MGYYQSCVLALRLHQFYHLSLLCKILDLSYLITVDALVVHAEVNENTVLLVFILLTGNHNINMCLSLILTQSQNQVAKYLQKGGHMGDDLLWCGVLLLWVLDNDLFVVLGYLKGLKLVYHMIHIDFFFFRLEFPLINIEHLCKVLSLQQRLFYKAHGLLDHPLTLGIDLTA